MVLFRVLSSQQRYFGFQIYSVINYFLLFSHPRCFWRLLLFLNFSFHFFNPYLLILSEIVSDCFTWCSVVLRLVKICKFNLKLLWFNFSKQIIRNLRFLRFIFVYCDSEKSFQLLRSMKFLHFPSWRLEFQGFDFIPKLWIHLSWLYFHFWRGNIARFFFDFLLFNILYTFMQFTCVYL